MTLQAMAHKVHDFFQHPARPPQVMEHLLEAARDPAHDNLRWRSDMPVDAIRNAHNTNNEREMAGALKGDYNCLEADVRLAGDVRPFPGYRNRPVIAAHGDLDTKGFTLQEWLRIGLASGRGLKLDIKSGSAVPEIIRQCQAAGVPSDHLILNGGVELRHKNISTTVTRNAINAVLQNQTSLAMLTSMRQAFPHAMIAITPSRQPESPADYARIQHYASEVGGRVMFPMRAEFVTPHLIEQLKPYGQIAIWNDPKTYHPGDVAADTARFRAMGADGIIDLRNEVEL